MPSRNSGDPERRRKIDLAMCSKDIRRMARKMLEGNDKAKIARRLGVAEGTLSDKVGQGRFSASEFALFAQLCGYYLDVKPRHKDLLE